MSLEVSEPILDLISHLYVKLRAKVQLFLICRDDLLDVPLLGAFVASFGDEGVDTLEDLSDVAIDGVGVFCLTNDLQKIGVWQEEESWEFTTLLGQQIMKLLLNDLKFREESVESSHEISDLIDQSRVSFLDLSDPCHLLREDLVNLAECGILLR